MRVLSKTIQWENEAVELSTILEVEETFMLFFIIPIRYKRKYIGFPYVDHHDWYKYKGEESSPSAVRRNKSRLLDMMNDFDEYL